MMESSDISFNPEDLAPKLSSEDLDLMDAEGNTYQWEVFYSFSLNGNEYMVFLPNNDTENVFVNVEIDDPDSDVPGYIVLRLETEESTGEEQLVEILDPAELEEISEYVMEEIPMISSALREEE